LDRAQLRLGQRDAHTRFQPGDRDHIVVTSASFEEQGIVLPERQIYVCVTYELKTRRKDPDNRVAKSSQRQGLAEHLQAAAEPVFPKAIADECDGWAAAPVVLRREIAAENWLDA